ncbi:high mobility group box domain-containing protein, partial [Gautieria morchelliformis]
IPRPPNCFMIFRSEICRSRTMSHYVNSGSVNSRIAGELWRGMSEIQKSKYRKKAQIAKEEHARAHPGYEFNP